MKVFSRREFLMKTAVMITAAAVVPSVLATDVLLGKVQQVAGVTWQISEHPRYIGWYFYSCSRIDGVAYDFGEVIDFDEWTPGDPVPERVQKMSAIAFDRARRNRART